MADVFRYVDSESLLMAKKKDHSSELEQLSRGKLRMVLSDWVVNSLDAEDYAFDFEVRPIGWIVDPREVDATPFYVQLKASTRLEHETRVWWDLDTSFLIEDCLTASIPVVLVVYDRAANECYWCVLQRYCWDVLDEEHDKWPVVRRQLPHQPEIGLNTDTIEPDGSKSDILSKL